MPNSAKPAAACPVLPPAERGQCTAATINALAPYGAQSAAKQVTSERTTAMEVGHAQLAGPAVQQVGGRKLLQKRLDLQQARPVSLNSPGAVHCPAASGCDGLHAAMLTQLELQDEEVRTA